MKSWVLPAATMVAVEYAFALLIGFRVGFRYRIPLETYAMIGAGIASLGVLIFVVVKFVAYVREREPRPLPRLLSDIPKCSAFVIGTFLVALEMGALTWTKIMLPIAAPFWADPMLATFGEIIFGAAPWRVAYALFGWAAPMMDAAYVTWVPIKFATLAILLTLPESRMKTRALVSYFLIMACTALGQYLLSSGGPVFYARLGFGNRFADLPIEPWVRVTTSYLWSDYSRAGGDIGAGISAMPSLHVAIALWIALVVRAYVPRLAALGYIYFALILIGSVLLGWHYVADGLAAIGITMFAWSLAGRPVRREEAATPAFATVPGLTAEGQSLGMADAIGN